jgi:hypothetical protein
VSRLVFEDRRAYHSSLEARENHESLHVPLLCCANNTGQQHLTFFLPTRRKPSNPDSNFNAEFKYVSSFSPSPMGFFVTAKLNVKKCVYTIHWKTKFNFFFGTRRKISVPDRTFNAEFKYVSSFSPSRVVFFVL